jgi:integrase
LTKSKENALTETEVELFLSACTTPKQKFIATVLVYSGLRVSELAHMTKSWVDWQEQTINVPESQLCDCGECKKKKSGVWTPKTKHGVRSIPFHFEIRLETILRAYFALYEDVGISRIAIFQQIKNIAKKSGITHRVYPHALRATAATQFGHRLPTPIVCYVMGWTLIKTGEVYITPSKRQTLEEFKRVYQNANRL